MSEVQGTIEIFIPVRLPGLNDMIASAKSGRGGGILYAREKSKIQAWICQEFSTLGIKKIQSCKIGFTWIEPDRRRDIDNISAGKKYILDALVTLGVLTDDSWRHVKGFLAESFEADKNNWGVLIRIEGV